MSNKQDIEFQNGIYLVPIIQVAILAFSRTLHCSPISCDSLVLQPFEQFLLNPFMILVYMVLLHGRLYDLKKIGKLSYTIIFFLFAGVILFEWRFWSFFWDYDFSSNTIGNIFLIEPESLLMLIIIVAQYSFFYLYGKGKLQRWLTLVLLIIPNLLTFWPTALLFLLFMGYKP